ncbi:restriction endonuclease [Bacillus wiedmannii]|nr:restriction endonuclease [Bacillus wiedmannii]
MHREKVKATRGNLEIMDPREFEYFVADFFRSLGYKVQVTSGSNDGGKDIILYKGNEMKFVEVKRYTKNSIGRPFIQKLHSAIVDADAVGGYFVTLSNFNQNARQYAANKNIELIDGDSLINMMKS